MKKVLILIALLPFVFSCKKDEPAPSNTAKLTGKNWKMTAYTISPGILGQTNLYAGMSACEKDDFTTYNTNGTSVDDEGATKCNSSDPQTTSGTWSWGANETTLIVKENGSSTAVVVNVLQNDGTTLKVSGQETVNNVVYTFTQTFTK